MNQFAQAIDPQIAQQAKDLLNHLRTSDYPPEHLSKGDNKKRYADARNTIKTMTSGGAYETAYDQLCVVLVLFVLGTIVNVLMLAVSAGTLGTASPLPLLIIVLLIVASIVTGHAAERKRRRATENEAAYALALPLLAHRSPVEREYALTVAAVFQYAGPLPATTRDALLEQLKNLVVSGRQLQTEIADAQTAMGGQSLEALEAEETDLAGRIQIIRDEEARDTLCQCRILCEERLGRARRLMPLWERLHARQEQVSQSFAATRAFVTGVTVAGRCNVFQPVTESGLSVTLGSLGAQTRAVEQAMSEVGALQIAR